MDRGNLGPGYYQDLNGYRGQGQYADFNKIQRTETTYVQGYPNQQIQGSSSILKDSLKKSIFGNQDELNVNLNRSKPPSRALTPTHKLRGRDDSYGYQPGTQNIGGYDPRTSDAHMNQNSGYGIQQQQYQTPYGQDPYRNQLQGTRTPGQNPSQINQSQGYYGQNQPVQTNQGQMYSQTQQGFQQTQYSPYPQTQLTYGQTQSHTKGQGLMTNPTPLKTQDPLQRTSTVVKVDPLLAAQNISNKSPYFAEKRVIVTGASSGIGRAVAMWFLNSGAKVALIGRDLESLINIGKQFPSQALVIKCDLSKDDQPYDMYNTVMSEFGGIDILVNAAGVLIEGDIKNMSPQDYDHVMDVNLRSVFYLSYLFFPALQKSKGCVINVSCQYGAKPFAGLYAYCMSKAGIECLTKQMAYEFASSGVRVNAVAPGLCQTNLLNYRKVPQNDIETIFANVEKFTPLKRTATIDDVGKAVIFLCSNAANHITGQILKVDGGRSLTSSNWHQWEGPKANNVVIESKESLINSFKGKVLAPSNIMLGYTELERIAALTKRTTWSTTDTDAHATIKYAKYQEQDVRHNIQDSDAALRVSLKKMFI